MLSINFLPFERPHLMLRTLQNWSNISENYKDKFTINIHTKIDDTFFNQIKDEFNKNNILLNIIYHPSHHYMTKIYSSSSTEAEYSMKIDEDIFINFHVLEYIIDNLPLLNNESTLILTPTLSTGIPSIEMFIEDVCTDDEKNILFNLFKNTHIPSIWGANYTSLNYHKKTWDYGHYYNMVATLSHHYKGIHPVRVNRQPQLLLCDLCIKYIDKIKNKNNYYIDCKHITYICNTVFIIKTDIWRNIINNKSLFRDDYDEVPLNLYMKNHNHKVCFIRNSNGIHPSYNTLVGYSEISDKFFNAL